MGESCWVLDRAPVNNSTTIDFKRTHLGLDKAGTSRSTDLCPRGGWGSWPTGPRALLAPSLRLLCPLLAPRPASAGTFPWLHVWLSSLAAKTGQDEREPL